jgi:hypothetical protein
VCVCETLSIEGEGSFGMGSTRRGDETVLGLLVRGLSFLLSVGLGILGRRV